MIITHACLEILDLRTSTHQFSDFELDFTKDLTHEYVSKIIEKVNKNCSKRAGSFHEDSKLKQVLKTYDSNHFIGFSKNVAKVFLESLKEAGILESSDLLVVEYREDSNTMLGLILLENQEGITHESIASDGKVNNEITKNVYILPTSGLRINTFLLVSIPDLNFYSVEKLREIDGVKKKVLEESIVNATFHPSTNEVLKAIKEEAKKISEEAGNDSIQALSTVKNYIYNHGADDEIDIKDLADTLFTDESNKKDFKEHLALRGVSLNEPLEYNLVENKVKNQKIKTDTGIELIVPSEFFKDNNNLEIIQNDDGTMTIQIKNFTKIIGR
jgi:nucleoid-associated protein YejK